MESTIPSDLRRSRQRRGYTLVGAGARSGLSPQHLSKVESGGDRGTQLATIEKMAAALEMTLVLVPDHLVVEVRRFINSRGRTFGVHAGEEEAPL